MNISRFSGPDAERSRLRTVVATIDGEISHLQRQVTSGGRPSLNALLSAWDDLVARLALGPEPEVRVCPVCKHVAMRAATLCGHCWTKLSPLP